MTLFVSGIGSLCYRNEIIGGFHGQRGKISQNLVAIWFRFGQKCCKANLREKIKMSGLEIGDGIFVVTRIVTSSLVGAAPRIGAASSMPEGRT